MMVIKVEDAKMVATIPIADPRRRGLMESQLGMYAFEAVPVVHARWIQADLDEDYVTCSHCKENGSKDRMAWTPEFAEILKHCPACGAKMDGEANEPECH